MNPRAWKGGMRFLPAHVFAWILPPLASQANQNSSGTIRFIPAPIFPETYNRGHASAFPCAVRPAMSRRFFRGALFPGCHGADTHPGI
jgi:hypothetical protein